MPTFTPQQIKEISDQLDCGFRAFYHKTFGDLIFVPHMDKHFDIEIDAWKAEFDKLKKNKSRYQEIAAMDSKDSFRIMEDFALQLSDTTLADDLLEALQKKHPFRHFKFAIDNSSEFRQSWFDFKSKRQVEWTEDQIKIQEEINSGENASR